MSRNIDLLRPSAIFASVVQEGSFKATANKFHLSPSVVSQSVSQLEAELGQQLLYRSTRKLTLTDAGRDYLNHIGRLDQLIEAARQAVMAPEQKRRQLRISVPTIIASPAFARFVARYAEQNPNIALEINFNDDRLDPIEHGFDLLIRIGHIDETTKGARLIFETSGILCVSPAHIEPLADPEKLDALCWIKTPAIADTLWLYEGEAEPSYKLTPSQTLLANNAHMVRELVFHGAGFGLFPEFSVQEAFQNGYLINAIPGWHAGRRGFFAIHSAQRTELSIAQGFEAALTAFIADLRAT